MTRNLTIEKSSRVAKLMSTLPLRAMVGLVGALLLSAASAWAQGNFVGLRPEFQYYYPSYTGYHLFDVSGALGAPASNGSHAGGKGARIQGYMYLQKGDILQIAAGGYGVPGVPAGNNVAGGGGGGGSSIVLSSGPSCGTTWPSCPRPLVFAGGGGGGTADQDGGPGLISNAAPPRGGVDSRGGKAVASGISSGGGGGGYETSGEDPGYSWNQAESPGGLAYLKGNQGGIAYVYKDGTPHPWGNRTSGQGGWGGGGAGGFARTGGGVDDNYDGGGGGGGGYSGGGGGDRGGAFSKATGGGGGGSYVDPGVSVCFAQSGANDAVVGSVIFQQLAGPAVGPVNSLSNMSVGRGSVATLGPVLSNPTGTTIQWLKDGVLQDGQSAASITLNPFQYTDSGAYQAVLTKAGCTTITRPVYLDTPSLSTLFGWGSNTSFQMGFAYGNQDQLSPVEVIVPFTTVTNVDGLQTNEKGVVAAAAGQSYSMLLKRDGTLWGMGANAAGQLGDGTTTLRASPVKVATDVVAVAAGGGAFNLSPDQKDGHTLFVKRDGSLWAMGSNSAGQLGDGTIINRKSPVQVASHVVAVSAGDRFSLFLREDGTLWGMGRNDSGQLGLDYPVGDATYTLKPRLIASGVVAAAAGEEYSLFLTGDQTLYGVGCVPQATSCSSVRKSVANGVSAVAAGSDHALFLRKGGGFLFAFGNNDKGQLGDGTTTNRSLTTPVAVIDETGTYQSGVAAVVAGRKNTLFKKANGTLWGMGDNGFGQLGQGNTTNQTKPKPILYNANQLTVATLGTLRFDQDWFDNLSCSASPDSSPQEKIAMRQGERAASSCQTWPEAHALVVAASGSSSNGGLQSVGPKPPPVIVIAGGDFQQSLQRIIIIDASGSTSSTGGPLTYQWSSSDPVWISGNTTAAPTVGLGYSRRLNTLQLTVTDSTGNSSTQQIQIEYLGPLQ